MPCDAEAKNGKKPQTATAKAFEHCFNKKPLLIFEGAFCCLLLVRFYRWLLKIIFMWIKLAIVIHIITGRIYHENNSNDAG